jgi:hypothetical protein
MSRIVLSVGIREAHVEKQRPDKKKNMLNAIRCLVFVSMGFCHLFRAGIQY